MNLLLTWYLHRWFYLQTCTSVRSVRTDDLSSASSSASPLLGLLTLLPSGGHFFVNSPFSSLSHPLWPQRPDEAAAPLGSQGEPGGLPRPAAPPRGLAAGQSRRGEPAAGGRSAAGPSQPLRPDTAGPGRSGRTRSGGGDAAEERWRGEGWWGPLITRV